MNTILQSKESNFLEELDDSRTGIAMYKMGLKQLVVSKVKKCKDGKGKEESKERRHMPYRWRYVKGTQEPSKRI